jgi:uncharacterized protein
MGEYLIKIHKAYRWVVAICDKELVGKKIEEGEKQLDLTGDFFRGEEKTAEEAKEIIIDCISEDSTFNIIGEKSCKFAEQMGIIKKEGILKTNDVPYALILL